MAGECSVDAKAGLNVNIVDSVVREMLIPTKDMCKILAAWERMLESSAGKEATWPVTDDQWA